MKREVHEFLIQLTPIEYHSDRLGISFGSLFTRFRQLHVCGSVSQSRLHQVEELFTQRLQTKFFHVSNTASLLARRSERLVAGS